MSLSTQERPITSENPFAIFSPAKPFPPPASSYRKPSKPVAVLHPQPAIPKPVTVPNSTSGLRGIIRSTILKHAGKALLVFLIAFSMMPDSLQTKAFHLLGLGRPAIESQLEATSLPLNYTYLSSPFGKRWGRLHQGVDLAAGQGSPIYAASAGEVIYSGWESGYGNSIIIDHKNGIKTRYAHCSQLLATVGKKVAKGALIAKVGSTGHSTGPHLHFEVIVKGVRKNPAWYYPLPFSRQQIAQAKG